MAIYTRTQQKHDIEANWIKAINFIPLEGEIIIYDADENYSYSRIKIGDGTTKVNDLPFDNIQGDWNQNDETSPDYVKNRTHYTETTTEELDVLLNKSLEGAQINPDTGVIEYFGYVDALDREFKAGTVVNYKLTYGNSTEEFSHTLPYRMWGIEVGSYGTDYLRIINVGDGPEMALNIKCLCDPTETNVADIFITVKAIEASEFVNQLDAKYIPASIARTSSVDTLKTEVNTVKTNVSKCVKSVNNKTPNDEGSISLRYDDLTDKPFGIVQEEGYIPIGVLDGRSFDFANQESGMYVQEVDPTDIAFADGHYVTWDGVEYEVFSDPAYNESQDYYLLGGAFEGEVSFDNYPFSIKYTLDYDSWMPNNVKIYTNQPGPHTVKVTTWYSGLVDVVKPIDEKYIPDTIARKSDVETAVNSLVDTAPEALNTLNELSKALGDDPNFATTVLTEVGKKVDKVNGKGLSANDYTTVEKNKLAGIEAGAQKNILGDWNQNDKTAANYIRNRTHYIEESKTELANISLSGYKTYSGSTGAEEWKIIAFLSQEEIDTLRTLLNDNDCYLEYSASIGAYNHKIYSCSSDDPSREFTIILEDGYKITIGFGDEAESPFNSPDQLPETLKTAIELSMDATYEGGFGFAVHIFQKEKIQKLDSKFLPIPSDCFQPIDLFTKLNITSLSAKNWPKSDEDIMYYLNQGRWNYWVKENLFTQLFDLFKNYPGFLPTFIISPSKTDKECIYQLICSTERIELDSYGSMGSPIHPNFNFIYLINLSKDNYLELRFNYNQFEDEPIDLDNFDPDSGDISLIFSLIPKGGNITTEQVAELAQEQIITPALTEEVY